MPAVPPYSSTTTAICSPDAAQPVEQLVAVERLRDGRRRLRTRLRSWRVGAGSAAATANACLTWTTPTDVVEVAVVARGSARSRCARPRRRMSATVSSASSDSTRTRGVISSSATRSVKRSERSSSVGGALVEGAAARRWWHERAELLGRAGRAQLLGGLHARAAARSQLAEPLSAADEPAERAGEAALQPAPRPRRAQRAGDGEVLRHELAEHHRQRRGEDEREHRGGRRPPRPRQAERRRGRAESASRSRARRCSR